MGHEILYCSYCALRILGAEFEKGKALRSGHRIACGKCRPALLAELSPAERAALETPPTVPAAPAAPRPAPLHGSSTRMKHAPPEAQSSSWIPAAAGVVLVVLLLLGTLLTRKPPAPVPPVTKAAPGPRPPITAPVAPVENPRLPAAREALAEARRSDAGNVDAAYAAWELAVRAADQTPLTGEAMQGYSQALERRRAAWKAAMDEGEREIRAALERKDGQAVRAVLEKLRGRHKGPEWTSKVDDLGRRLEGAIQEARPWIPLFDGKTREFLRGGGGEGFAVEDGLWVLKRPSTAMQTRREFMDGELRVRFEISGGETLFFAVRQGGGGSWVVRWDASKGISQLEGGVRELQVVMKGPAVRATLDGRDVAGEQLGKPGPGCLQFNVKGAAFKLHSAEFRELP